MLERNTVSRILLTTTLIMITLDMSDKWQDRVCAAFNTTALVITQHHVTITLTDSRAPRRHSEFIYVSNLIGLNQRDQPRIIGMPLLTTASKRVRTATVPLFQYTCNSSTYCKSMSESF
jgi:hypothetical protein